MEPYAAPIFKQGKKMSSKVLKLVFTLLVSIFVSPLGSLFVAQGVLADAGKMDESKMEGIPNFFQISANIGTGGQPTLVQLDEIAAQEYTLVVNLAMADSDHAIVEEGDILASHGIKYVHIPVPFDAPDASHLKAFFEVMDAHRERKIFVHCVVNARASVFTYKYLTLRKDVPSDEASTPLLNKWLPGMDDAWRAMMALQIEDI